jgi:predicted transcriptional regulator
MPGAVHFRFLYYTCAIHHHQAPVLLSTCEGIYFVTHVEHMYIRIIFLFLLMYNLVSFVTRGSVRRKVLKGLIRPNTPTELAKTVGVARAAVSRTIQELEKIGLVECLTPDENRDRYYQITETGKKVAETIEGLGK